MASYIHFHIDNYKRYNISRKSESAISPTAFFSDYKEKFIQQIENNKNKQVISRDTLDTFENVYSYILNPSKASISEKNEFEEIRRIAFEAIKDSIKNYSGGDLFKDFDVNGHVIFNESDEMKELNEIRNKLNGIRNKIGSDLDLSSKKFRSDSIKKRIEKILQTFDNETLTSMDGNLTAQKITQAINNLKQEVSNISNVAIEELYDARYVEPKLKEKVSKALKENSFYDANSNIIIRLIEIYDLVKSPAIGKIQGNIGEIIGELTNLYVQNTISGTTKTLLDPFKNYKYINLGSKTNKIDLNNYFKKVNNKPGLYSFKETFKDKDGNYSIQLGEQKVDIIIQDPNTGQQIGTQVKNYNIGGSNSWIKVLDKMPLSTLLLSEGEKFTYNYLNAVAAVYKEDNDKDHLNDKIVLEYTTQSNEALRLAALKTALEGTKFEQKNQLFLLNDSSGVHGVKIFTINELISKFYEVEGGISFKKNSIPYYTLKNKPLNKEVIKFIPNNLEGASAGMANTKLGYERSAKIFAEAHKQKLSVSLNPFTFREMISGSSS